MLNTQFLIKNHPALFALIQGNNPINFQEQETAGFLIREAVINYLRNGNGTFAEEFRQTFAPDGKSITAALELFLADRDGVDLPEEYQSGITLDEYLDEYSKFHSNNEHLILEAICAYFNVSLTVIKTTEAKSGKRLVAQTHFGNPANFKIDLYLYEKEGGGIPHYFLKDKTTGINIVIVGNGNCSCNAVAVAMHKEIFRRNLERAEAQRKYEEELQRMNRKKPGPSFFLGCFGCCCGQDEDNTQEEKVPLLSGSQNTSASNDAI